MPAPPLAELAAPATTAIVTSEVQNGVVGAQSALPELAAVAGRPDEADRHRADAVAAAVAGHPGAGPPPPATNSTPPPIAPP